MTDDKDVVFLGSSLADLRGFPDTARREAGYQLDRVQQGLDPTDSKPMNTVGAGVREIRIWVEGAFRVIFVAKFEEAVYVLHALRENPRDTEEVNRSRQAAVSGIDQGKVVI